VRAPHLLRRSHARHRVHGAAAEKWPRHQTAVFIKGRKFAPIYLSYS
jgi:hypothetical protein